MAASPSPQPVAVGETNVTPNKKTPYAATLKPQQTTQNLLKTVLKPIEFIHGEPTVRFTMEEREQFAREEGLHQAVIIKFAYGKPVLSELRKLLPKQFDVKGNCNIGQLDFRHLLVRFDLYEDFVQVLSSSYGYFKFDGEEYLFRIFLWTPSFNPKEETSKALVWISLPELPPDLFARRSLLSIAAAAGKPIAVDKATQDCTRPSTARVKVIIDLLEKHPNRVRLQFLEKESGKIIEHYQKIVYDNLPLYCTHCKHQGHEENKCLFLMGKTVSQGAILGDEAGRDVALMLPDSEANNMEQLKGDARDFLNAKRAKEKDIEKPVGDRNMGQQSAGNINKDNSVATVASTSGGNQIVALGIQSDLVTGGINPNVSEQSIGKQAAGHIEKELPTLPISEPNSSTVATSGNQTLVSAGEVLQQQQMDVPGVRNNQQGEVLVDLVDHVGVEEQNSGTVTKALVVASKVDPKQQLSDVVNESATGVRLGIKDTAEQLDCNATGNKSPSVGDLGQEKELVKQSSGIKKMFSTDCDKRIAQCDALSEKLVVVQHENMKIIAASKPLDLEAENSSSEENASGNWTVIAHKKSLGSRIGSSTSRSNSPSREKGVTGNFQLCANHNLILSTQNVFEPLSAPGKIQLEQKDMSSFSQADFTKDLTISKEKQGEISAPKWADLVDEEEQVSPPPLNSKLSPEASVFMPKSVIAKQNEQGALASGLNPINAYAVDLDEDFFEEDEEDNILDICFEKVARDGDLSPRQQRSVSNKSKKKTHGRQHSWDGKVTEEFVLRHLPMRLATQNHMIVSTTSVRSNKSKKK